MMSDATSQAILAAEPKMIIARYGEMWLKGRNRALFSKVLKRNVRMALRPFPGTRIERLHGQFAVHTKERGAEVFERLRDIFGFVSISPVWRVRTHSEDIVKAAPIIVERALEDFPRNKSVAFRVTTRRAHKGFPFKSIEIDRMAADAVLPRFPGRLHVDLEEPEIKLEINLRPEGTYLFVQRVPGAGGLPVGSLGRVVCLLSGGIDSPVAAWRAMRRGCHTTFVSFHSYPYLGESSKEKIRRLARTLARYQRVSRLHSVPFTRIQESIRDNCPEPYRTVLYRRMMQRIAGRIAKREKAGALVTGESVGQVASQTLENLHCIESASELPVLRPLISNDKQETVELAKRIGTFEVSTQPEPDCCTVFQPKEPVIRGRLWVCEKVEEELDVEGLVEEAVEGAELEILEYDA